MSARLDDAALRDLMPLADTLDLRLVESGRDAAVVELDHRPQWCTVGGTLHGGVITALADTAAGVCAFENLPEGASTATIGLSITFLAPVTGGRLRAVAHPVGVGRNVITLRVDVHQVPGDEQPPRQVATATQNQAVIGG